MTDYVVEILLSVQAPDMAAVERIAEEATTAARRTNVRVRDGRIDNAMVADIRGEDE